jgi:hypothetical protein
LPDAIFAVGSLVKARGREWVVLPESQENMLILRPLGGKDDEITGVYLPLETVEPANFDWPDPKQAGDYHSARLLRDAVRLGFRSSAGPFRSFGRLGLEPRPYQLVPLIMALKLDPVRILIADDVGIGKTIEAGLIARELLDRGEIERMTVLCPPHLAEQWQAELSEKFHIEAELVLPSTAARLEPRQLDKTIFDIHPFTIVSLDFIKQERRRAQFLNTCPELVIIDEVHTCADGAEHGNQQRYKLISALAGKPSRHMIMVTASPHSGNEDAFRSIIQLLNPEFKDLPEDLSGSQSRPAIQKLAEHFIQRKRVDIIRYLGENTQFPTREESEITYHLSPEYKRLFDKVLEYARETVKTKTGSVLKDRIQWWSILALLRSMASSPVAASSTLRNRAATLDADSPEAVDEIGKKSVLDLIGEDTAEGQDVLPGADYGEEDEASKSNHRRLLEFAREADTLIGAKDKKLQVIIEQVKVMLAEGFTPIIFCRFIPTAEYIAEELRASLKKDIEVAAITGLLPPAERIARIEALAEHPNRVLVATDCLSEGINLQEYFDAVIHYDLSWNPTRHEQREGRVDRFGQKAPKVRVATLYGTDNQIDGVVLEVLIKKHKRIRSDLGISIPVPGNSEQVIEALLEGLLLRGYQAKNSDANLLPGMEEYFSKEMKQINKEWELSADREKQSRSIFAQVSIKPDEVQAELNASRDAIGSGVDLKNFVRHSLAGFGAAVGENKGLVVDLSTASAALKNNLAPVININSGKPLKIALEFPAPDGFIYIPRTHPFVETLAAHVLETSLDPDSNDAKTYNLARRCGVIRTKQVVKRTTLLLLRLRYHLVKQDDGKEKPLLVEDTQLLAFLGSPGAPEWLSSVETEALLDAVSAANITPTQAQGFLQEVLEAREVIEERLKETAIERGKGILETHKRVRRAAKTTTVGVKVEPQLPPDVLGIFIFLPALQA